MESTDTMNSCKIEACTRSLLRDTMQSSVFDASLLGMSLKVLGAEGFWATLFQLASWFPVSYETILG